MQIKEGSRINISGRIDEENWEENGQKYSRNVIIADEIEYASSASENGKSNNGNASNGTSSVSPNQNGNGQNTAVQTTSPDQNQKNSSGDQTGTPPTFTGYEEFGNNDDGNAFF
jgi:single-stranded DNA-binding protein